jgi:AbrB family looped-hinge helix DNA binding protein
MAVRRCYAVRMIRREMKVPRGPNRVREAAVAYGTVAEPSAYAVTMADRGRLVLPAEVREQLKIKEGDRLTLRVGPDGTLTMQTAAVFARSLRGMFKHLAPGRSLVDDLIAERRREAAMEDRKDREFLTRRKRRAKR